ncbi:MAG: type VI secretion system-associated FHA domain protein TagH [Hyphomicrobiales bacterium]|nr:type VI secretion system-associated FHA domain protein TagH [Hyphomicrobiales bacterium]MBV8663154.1 type VI secretion system-associated FHA domain protein TagH [Hyphomicrobiales bacterium]
MRLLLAITSEEGRELGHRARHEFGQEGGTIGRNAACTWALPDPTNVLSARHATIAFNGRGFEIVDTSTNGVYVNTVRAPIGRGASAILADGDTLYFGPFEVSVTLVEDAAEERRRLGVGEAAITLRSEPARPVGGAATMRANLAPESELWGLAGAPRPAAPASRPPAPIAAPPAPAAPSVFPPDLVSAPQIEPAVAPLARPPAPPARSVIPADMFADILGPAAIAKADSRPASGGFAPPPASPQADPLGFAVPQAPRAGAGPLPDAFDFSDLLNARGIGPAQAPKPAPLQPRQDAAPLSQEPPPLEPSPLEPVAPPQAEQKPPQTAPPQPAPLSPSLSADLISLRAPGASEETPGARALDPIVVLRQRAAGQGRPSAGDANAPPPLPLPARRPRDASLPLPQPAPERAAAPGPEAADQARLAEAFWNGLGVDAKETPPERQAELLAECGRALRAAVVGLVPTLNARRSMKDELRIDQTRLQPKENNPLKFLPSGEAVLQALLDRQLDGFLPLSQALREGLDDIKAHEVATLVALDAVVRSILARFDPVVLEAQSGAPAKVFGRGPDKARLWDNFARLHATLSGDLEETTRKLVGEEFARAYAQQVETFRRGGA